MTGHDGKAQRKFLPHQHDINVRAADFPLKTSVEKRSWKYEIADNDRKEESGRVAGGPSLLRWKASDKLVMGEFLLMMHAYTSLETNKTSNNPFVLSSRIIENRLS